MLNILSGDFIVKCHLHLDIFQTPLQVKLKGWVYFSNILTEMLTKKVHVLKRTYFYLTNRKWLTHSSFMLRALIEKHYLDL